jgi:hypothetical protein
MVAEGYMRVAGWSPESCLSGGWKARWRRKKGRAVMGGRRKGSRGGGMVYIPPGVPIAV